MALHCIMASLSVLIVATVAPLPTPLRLPPPPSISSHCRCPPLIHEIQLVTFPRPSSHYKILLPSFSFLIIIISCFSFSQGYFLFSHFSLSFTFWSFSFASLIQATPVNTNDPTGWHIMQILFEIVNVTFTNGNRYNQGISNIVITRDNWSHTLCKNSFVNIQHHP